MLPGFLPPGPVLWIAAVAARRSVALENIPHAPA